MKHNKIAIFGLIVMVMCALFIGTSNPAQTQQQKIFNRPPLTLLDVEYSPDGKYIAQVYASGKLEVIEVTTNRIQLEDEPILQNALLRAKVAWSPKGDLLAAGIGAEIYVWDIAATKLLYTIKAGSGDPLVYSESGYYTPEGFASLQWDSTGTLLMAKSVSSRFTVWSTEQQTLIADQIYGNNPVPVVWLPDNRHISDGSTLWDIQTQEFEVRRTYRIPANCMRTGSIASNPDRTQIVIGTFNGCLIILDANTGDEIALYRINHYTIGIWDVDWSPDGKAIAAVDDTGAVQVVEIATGRVTLIDQQDGVLYAVDWAKTNTAIAYGGVTNAEGSISAIVDMAEITQMMRDNARQAEFAVTPPPKS